MLFRSKLINKTSTNSSEINLFIPNNMIKFDTELPTCSENNIANALDTEYVNRNIINSNIFESENKLSKEEQLKKIREKIEELEIKKKSENRKLTNLKDKNNLKQENMNNEIKDIFIKKKELERQKEKKEEFTNKFNANKKVYNMIKDNIKTDSDIPELFIDEYPLFKNLDDNGFLNTSEEIKKYIEILPTKTNRIKYMVSSKYSNMFGNCISSSESDYDESSEYDSTDDNSDEEIKNDLQLEN